MSIADGRTNMLSSKIKFLLKYTTFIQNNYKSVSCFNKVDRKSIL